MSFSVDHQVYSPEQPEDAQTDPEGVSHRAQRPASNNPYVQDMMEYNEKFKRWEPAQWFIQQTARIVPETVEKTLAHIKPEREEERVSMLAMLDHARTSLESGPFTGFLYGLKDLVLRQLCSVYIWMESNEAIRTSRINAGEDPESDGMRQTADAIEKNRVAFLYYARLLRAMKEEEDNKISLNDFAWRNAAKQAAWDFLGYHKRQTENPQRGQERAVRRSGAGLVLS